MQTIRCLAAAALFALAGTATAAAVIDPIVPTFTSFGPLPQATFNGNGIPNTAVAIYQSPGDLTLGLTATSRYVAPGLLPNDGAGTFTAQSGVSTFAPSPADPYATWNFNYYIGGGDVSDLAFRLYYDFDPAAGNDIATHGYLDASGLILAQLNLLQESWNLGMDFLTGFPGITPPAGSFDPDATGEYTFALVAYQPGGAEVGRAAIRVNVVGAAVPEPASLALVGIALLAAGAARRRRS